jgi:hypothetical protein
MRTDYALISANRAILRGMSVRVPGLFAES